MNNSSDFDNKKERDFHVQFERAVRNSVQNSPYIFERMPRVVVNTRQKIK